MSQYRHVIPWHARISARWPIFVQSRVSGSASRVAPASRTASFKRASRKYPNYFRLAGYLSGTLVIISHIAVHRPLAVATIDAVALLRHPPLVLQLRMHSS